MSCPPPRPHKPTETELVGNVERLDLAYWGPSSSGQEAGWQTQWEGPAIPELIRVRLGFGEKDRRRFPRSDRRPSIVAGGRQFVPSRPTRTGLA